MNFEDSAIIQMIAEFNEAMEFRQSGREKALLESWWTTQADPREMEAMDGWHSDEALLYMMFGRTSFPRPLNNRSFELMLKRVVEMSSQSEFIPTRLSESDRLKALKLREAIYRAVMSGKLPANEKNGLYWLLPPVFKEWYKSKIKILFPSDRKKSTQMRKETVEILVRFAKPKTEIKSFSQLAARAELQEHIDRCANFSKSRKKALNTLAKMFRAHPDAPKYKRGRP